MTQNLFDLEGKVAVVTGASKGIGEAMARAMADHGARVVLCSRDQAAVDAAANAIEEAGGLAVGIAANVSHAADRERLIEATVARFGRLDVLINNAAVNPVYGPVAETDEAAFDKIMTVNVKAPFELAKLARPHLAADGGGCVINISSIGGVSPEPGLGIYSVSKAALISLTKVLAAEWGPVGIRVNAVCPGLIKTKFSQALWRDEKLRASFERHLPIRRIGMPEEVAGIAVYLAAGAGAYTTGAVLMVDGGHTI